MTARPQPAEKPDGRKGPRRTVDYSVSGAGIAAEPPITVQDDELLQRLKGGAR